MSNLETGSLENEIEKDLNEIVIKHVVEQLQSEAFTDALSKESIGGNAGKNRSAVNALVNRETGEIIRFDNYIESSDSKNPEYGEVAFIYDMDKYEFRQDEIVFTEKGKIAEIVDRSGLSEIAMNNLRAAVEKVNSER